MVAGWFKVRLSRPPARSDYWLALTIAAIAVALRLALGLLVPGTVYFITLFPAIVVIGILCGPGPAVLGALVSGSILGGVLFGSTLIAWPIFNAQQANLLALLPACAIIIWSTSALRRFASDAAAAEARLAEVFRQIPGAAAIIEAPDGRLLLRSTQSNDILEQGERTIKHVSALGNYGGLHPNGDQLRAEEYPIARALRTGEIVRSESLLYRRPSGDLIHLDVHAGPVLNPDGNIVAAVGMAFDVSERVGAERRLREQEAQQRATAEKLQAALDSREILIREADHRIKNSLQLVVSLLRLQLRRVTDPDAKTALEAAVARVHAVSDVHLALQQSPDLRTLQIGQMLADLCQRMGALNPAVSISCEVDPSLVLDAELAIPLGLIVSEWLTNALRHAYPPDAAGKVTVAATCLLGRLSLVVADHGAGFHEASVQAKLGGTVVRSLARQLGATLHTESVLGQGTTVSLSIDLVAQADQALALASAS